MLAAIGLARDGAFVDVSLEVRAGEILGFAGLVGSGRTEIARVLFGVDQPTAGTIALDGYDVAFASPGDAMAAGIAYVSEDRIGQSLVMDFPILANASLPVIDQATLAGLIRPSRELGLVRGHLDRLRLRFRSYLQPVKTLSGGNQQKVVLSKWLATKPRVLILDEPTQGIDVQTKAEVHAVIADLARQGLAIILISSELPELLGMCDRIMVLREGRVTAELTAAEATQERVLYAMTDAAGAEAGTTRHAVVDPVPAAHPASWLRRLVVRRELGLLLAMVAVIVPVVAVNPRMLSGANLSALAMDAGLLTIVAVGQMLVVLTRNIDLSVASVIGLAAYVSADLLRSHPELGVTGGILAASAVGLACGLLNGLVVTVGRELYAIGSNPDGAQLIGIHVRCRVLGAFACSGLLAGFDDFDWADCFSPRLTVMA